MERTLGLPDEAAGEALAFGESEGEVDLLGVVCAASGAEKARAAMHAPMKCDLFFIRSKLCWHHDGPAKS